MVARTISNWYSRGSVTVKIRTRLLLLMGIVVVVLVVLISTMYVKSSGVIMDIANTEGIGTTEDEAKIIDLYFNGLINIGENASPGVKNLFAADGSVVPERLVALMTQLLRANASNNMMNMYTGVEATGKMHTGNGYVPPADFDARKRPWYMAAVAARKTIVTDPYIDSETKELVVSTGTPLFDDAGKVLGVIGTDVSLKTLADYVKKSSVLGSGFGVLLTKDGTFAEHPEASYIMQENIAKSSVNVGTQLAAIGTKIVNRETGWGDYTTTKGDEHRIFYTPCGSGYIAALVFPHDQIGAVVSRVTLIQIIAGVIALILIVGFMLFMIPGIVNPIRAIERSLTRIADLDLTVDPQDAQFESAINRNTEIGGMVVSLQHMRSSLGDVVSTVRGGVEKLTAASHSLDNLAGQASDDVEHSRASADMVEKLAHESLGAVANAASAIEEVSHAATMTATSATEGAEASSITSKLSNEVADRVGEFVGELQAVGSAAAENSEGMTSVGASVASIAEFVTTIRNIASQTNLLALNAAIEAARAGEAGRGFAVVADEVRKLAEESNVASQRVAEMIEKLESGTQAAIESTQESAVVISGIVAKAQETQESLKQTLDQIDKVNDAVQTIAAAAQEQAASSNEISDSAGQVKDGIERVVDELANITKTARETAVVMEDVASESKQLTEIAADLESTMRGFKLNEGGRPRGLPMGR